MNVASLVKIDLKVVAVVCLLTGAVLSAQGLLVTEIMFHPPDPGESLEYVELYNATASPLDISGYRFFDGIDYEFPEGIWFEPYSYIVVAKDPSAFEAEYGFSPYGPYEGFLENGGERLTFSNDSSTFDDTGQIIVPGPPLWSARYNDRGKWPNNCKGTGHSLSLRSMEMDPEEPAAWASSPERGGTPGAPNGFGSGSTWVTSQIIPQDSSGWRFKRGTQEASSPITAWRQLSFNDAGWEQGRPPIGYGTAAHEQVNTPLNDMEDNYLTCFIRREFTVANLEHIDRLTLYLRYDDGFVAYLNGQEVARGNVDGNPPPYDSPSDGGHEADTSESFDITGFKSLLNAGNNVLCIQGHNTSTGSSDFILAPYLVSEREIKPTEATDDIVFNECLHKTAAERWVELYNTADSAVDLSGYYLSRDPEDLTTYQFGVIDPIPGRGFLVLTESELGFSLEPAAPGPEDEPLMTLLLTNPDQTRVVAARTFDADVAYGSSAGRYPDGAIEWHETEEPTPDAPNVAIVAGDVVINEIMYHPFHVPNPYTLHPGEEGSEREYIELLNISDRAIDVGGWYFSKGITYFFPEGTIMMPSQYVIVARDPERINQIYSPEALVVGPYVGQLANGGELVRLKDALGNTVDEVTYFDGGRWPRWADGLGSSLELIDPWQDNTFASAWDASDDRSKAEWVDRSFYGVHGGESEIQFLLTHRGEMLLDDVHVSETRSTNPNLVTNPGFESGRSGWQFYPGTHEASDVVQGDAHSGSRALLVASSGRGDTWYNNIEHDFSNPTLRSGRNYYVSYWAKWQRGHNWFYVRGHRGALELTATLVNCSQIPVPQNLGTPGAVNSVYLENQGPVIGSLHQTQAAPRAGTPVTISCSVDDFDGVDQVDLKYFLDTSPGTVRTVQMRDDGAHGDGESGDAVYGGTIPGQSGDVGVGFWIEAIDDQGADSVFPYGGQDNPACYRIINDNPQTELPIYRIVQLRQDSDELYYRKPMANSLVSGSFVYNDQTIYHNVGIRFRGSPWIRGSNNRGTGYRVRFNQDQKLHGRIYEMNLDRQHQGGGGALMKERAIHHMIRRVGRHAKRSVVPYSWFQAVRAWHMPQRGSSTAWADIYDHIQHVDRKYIEYWWGNDSQGTLFKVDDWFECANDDDKPRMASVRGDDATAKLVYLGNGYKEYQRWFFKARTNELYDPGNQIVDFTRFIHSTPAAMIPQRLPSLVDVDSWLAILCVRFYVGDWDTIGYNRGKNAYIYQRVNDPRWYIIPWDSDLTFGSGNINDRLYCNAGRFPGMAKMFNVGAHLRKLYSFYEHLINGPANINTMNQFLSRTYSTFSAETISRPPGYSEITSYMQSRNNVVAGRIAAQPFRITSPSSSPVERHGITPTITETIQGSAPYSITDMQLDGESVYEQLSWNSANPQRWSYQAVLEPGTHDLVFVGLDENGNDVGSVEVTITYSQDPVPEPTGINPREGSDEGGTPVTVSGTNFQDGAAVYFGTNEASSVTFVNANTLIAVTPAARFPGTSVVDVRVVNPDSGSGILPAAFTYQPLWPLVTSLHPNKGTAAGGEIVTLVGERFQAGARVFFGDQESPAVAFVSATELEAVTPAGSLGSRDVRVENPDGRFFSCTNCFSYTLPPPEVTQITPAEGRKEGGTQVEILGRNFQTGGDGIVVMFGFAVAPTIVEEAETRLVVITPEGNRLGPVDVMVTDGASRTVTVPGGFTYTTDQLPPPEVTSLSPSYGPRAGGTRVEINGRNFQTWGEDIVVMFGSSAAITLPGATTTQIAVETPPGDSLGPVDVLVTDGGQRQVLVPDGFIYGNQPTFRRGDANCDSSPNIGDAIFILGHLFAGDEAVIRCEDALDINDDGAVDISDPIYLLQYLFVSGPPPAPPFPDLGEDPTTGDSLGCAEPCGE